MPNYAGTRRNNLGQISLPREQYIENCRKGGIASQESRRRKKRMAELANVILELSLQDGNDIKQALEESGFEDEATIAAGILFAQAKKAMNGDTDAARFVRDTSGQRPADGLLVGTIEERPFDTIDLVSLSDEELRRLAAAKEQEALPEFVEE